jgi:adenylate kinase family enzyme
LNAKRIIVYGVTGSGKTTLAKRLAEIAGLPYISVDDLTWEPGWIKVPFDDQRALFKSICEGEEWILDNAYGHWIEIPLERAELIVALDYPRWVSFYRLVARSIARLLDKRTVCNGNRESLRLMFSRESILLWHVTSFKRKRAKIRQWLKEGRPMVCLRSVRETEAWIAGLNKDS